MSDSRATAERDGERASRVTVLIADDNPLVRQILGEMVDGQESLDLVALAADADQAINLARRHRPSVVLADVDMPGGGGPRVARELHDLAWAPRVLALSSHEDQESVIEMLRAGASGYLVKGSSVESIVDAIHRCARGESVLATEVTGGVIEGLTTALDESERAADLHRRRIDRIERVLDGSGLEVVFQPLYDLDSNSVYAVEALSRFADKTCPTPEAWFSEAAEVGLRVDLELAAIRAAFRKFDLAPPNARISLNASPETAVSTLFAETLSRFNPQEIIIEITEHARVDDYERLHGALEGPRDAGMLLAVDDAGAGFASLRHILRLAPDIIKLDISLIRDIHRDSSARALSTAMISFAGAISAKVVAEGIECEEELEVMRELGVQIGQGYHLGRPEPLPLR